MVPPPERLADDHEPTSNLSRWMGAWSEYAEAWGSSFWDKDPRPGALAQTPPGFGANTRTADEIVLPALLVHTSAGGC
jgi:hypothetical protein